MLTIIDSDSLCYANAFAVQEKCELTGEVEVTENGEKFLRSKLRSSIAKIIEETGGTDYKLFLTGTDNFREDDYELRPQEYPKDMVPVIPSLYKKNREGMPRPLLLQEARDYLVDEFNAIIVNGMEADDQVCIEQTACIENDIDCCIAHIDKDINQQSGWHYRWPIFSKPSELYFVTELEGLRNLYVQALVGDKCDNIMYYYSEDSGTWKKNYGLGQKTAEKALAEFDTEEDMYSLVKAYYLDGVKFTRKDTGEQATLDDLHANMRLLYLLRTEDDEWSIPV